MEKPRPTDYRPEPRGWTAEQAAYYCGVSVPTFLLDWAPLLSPRLVGREKTRRVWDRRDIDRVWDLLSGIAAPRTDGLDESVGDLDALADSYRIMEQREQEAVSQRGRKR